MEEGQEELPGEEDGGEGDPELVASSSDVEEFLQTEWDTFLSRNDIMTRSSSPLNDQGRMASENMLNTVFPGLLGQFSCVWQRWKPLSSSLGGLNLHRSCVIYMHAVICSSALPLQPIPNVPGAQWGCLLNHHPPLQAWNQSIIHIFTVWVYICEITVYLSVSVMIITTLIFSWYQYFLGRKSALQKMFV